MYLWKFKNNLLRQITPFQFCARTVLFYGAIPASKKKYLKLLNLVIVTITLSLCFIVFSLVQTDIEYRDFKAVARILYVYEAGLVTLSVYFRFIGNRKKILRCTREAEYLSTLSRFKGNWLSVGGRLCFLFAQYLYTSHLLNSATLRVVLKMITYCILDGLTLLLSEIYIQIIFLLRHEYGRIKVDLVEWIESYNNNPELASEYRLLQIQRRHGILCHLANSLDKIYSLEIFLYVTQNITFILMIIIAPSNYTNMREAFTSANTIFYIDKPFNIIYPCLMTELLRRTMIESEKVIYRIRLDQCHPEIFNTLTLISLQLKYRKPRFDCGGFVKMDIRFLVSIMKVLISYTATLAQLSKNQ